MQGGPDGGADAALLAVATALSNSLANLPLVKGTTCGGMGARMNNRQTAAPPDLDALEDVLHR